MKRSGIIFLGLILFFQACKDTQYSYQHFLQTGDIIFQISPLFQHRVMGWLGQSKINHCGIIVKENDRFYVLEMLRRAEKTPLEQWIQRGKGGKFIVGRLRSLSTGTMAVRKFDPLLRMYRTRLYDLKFSWDDQRLYNAEFVRKMLESTLGIYVGKVERFDYSHLSPAYQDSLRNFPYHPLEQTEIVTPRSILEHDGMEIVYSNF